MVQWVKVPCNLRLVGLNSIPRAHVVEGEGQLLQAVIWPPHVHHGTCSPPTQLMFTCLKLPF
jgi:hypothetical protein